MPAIDKAALDRRGDPGTAKMLQARGGLRSVAEARSASAARLARETRARQLPRYRLRAPDGLYVNMDLSGFCEEPAYAWIGFKQHLEVVLERRPDLRACRIIKVMPPQQKGVW